MHKCIKITQLRYEFHTIRVSFVNFNKEKLTNKEKKHADLKYMRRPI